MNRIYLIFVMAALMNGFPGHAQLPESNSLFQMLKVKDSLLFDRAFNHCETFWLENLIAEDFEFYHDQSGVTSSKEAFLKVMREGICRSDNPYRSRRELLLGSLEVFPMLDNGALYGALQRGTHRFFEIDSSGRERKGSTAQFSHLWVYENNDWKLKRVLSFNHHNP